MPADGVAERPVSEPVTAPRVHCTPDDRPAGQVPVAEHHRDARRTCVGCPSAKLPALAQRAARVPHPEREHPRRAFRRRAGHRRADDRPALRLRHPATTASCGTSATRPTRTRCSPGRREQLHTIKQHGGLAPFPTRAESEYDTFGVGHSSTSISAALGMAVAAAQLGEDRRVVAVIGDGAMTAGMAFEALNHAGSLPTDLLVILNDNDMSISENVGALSNHFARALSGRVYAHLREGGKKVLRADADGVGAGAPLRRAPEGHGAARHAVRGAGLQLHRPDRRPRRQGAGHARCSNVQQAARPAVPARRHAQGQGLRARRGRSRSSGTGPGPFDPASGTIFKEKSTGPTLLADLRPVAVRHGRARSAHHRHHARDARRLGPGRVLQALPGPLFRRRHRRAARGDVRRGTRGRRAEAGGRDLLDLPAARLRSAHPRRRAAEPAGGVRASIAPAWSAATARRTRAATTVVTCAASPTWWSWRRRTRTSAARCCTPRARCNGPSAVRYPRGTGPGRRRSRRR